MMTNVSNDIDRFFTYFQELHEGVREIKFTFADVQCKSILFCSILDTLSKVVYSKVPSNRDRFCFFVDDFSGWSYRDRISLIQLRYFIQNETDLKYEKTKSFLNDRFKGLRPGSIYKATSDLTLPEIPHLKVIEDEIRRFTYSSLLYKYRNSVVHEFKTPGSGMDFGNLEELYYHHMGHYEIKDDQTVIAKSTWELVFPLTYLSSLVDKSISNLRDYCHEHAINPYNYFLFDVAWLTRQEVKQSRKK